MSPGQRSYLFREVNDRIYELLESAEPDLPGEFLCECRNDCGRRVLLLPAEFVTLRQTGEAVQSPSCAQSSGAPRSGRPALAGGVPALS